MANIWPDTILLLATGTYQRWPSLDIQCIFEFPNIKELLKWGTLNLSQKNKEKRKNP